MPDLKYATGPGGWNAPGGHWLDPGVIVDTSVWGEFANVRPPPDCVPLDQQTYDWFVSKGVVGLGYPYWMVAVVAGVVGLMPAKQMTAAPITGVQPPWEGP
jgi:hypothetical protein